MSKKTYRKPELKTHKVELGVYGDYGNGRPGHHGTGTTVGGSCDIDPVNVVSDLHLRME